MDMAIGLLAIVMAAGLIWAGKPDRAGNSPRFLRFGAAPVLYPPLILVFVALGAAESLYALLR